MKLFQVALAGAVGLAGLAVGAPGSAGVAVARDEVSKAHMDHDGKK